MAQSAITQLAAAFAKATVRQGGQRKEFRIAKLEIVGPASVPAKGNK